MGARLPACPCPRVVLLVTDRPAFAPPFLEEPALSRPFTRRTAVAHLLCAAAAVSLGALSRPDAVAVAATGTEPGAVDELRASVLAAAVRRDLDGVEALLEGGGPDDPLGAEKARLREAIERMMRPIEEIAAELEPLVAQVEEASRPPVERNFRTRAAFLGGTGGGRRFSSTPARRRGLSSGAKLRAVHRRQGR